MADRIHVVPGHLREAAVHHEQTSDTCGPSRRRTPRSRRAWTHWGRSSVSFAMPAVNCLSSDASATSNKPMTMLIWRRT